MERTVSDVTSGSSFHKSGAERPSKTTPNLDGLPPQWTTITLRKCLLWFVKNRRPAVREVAEEAAICKSSCHLLSTDKLQTRRVVEFVPRLLTDTLLIREFLMKHEKTAVPQPPYSPDFAPADFYLFSKLKSSLKGRRFQKVEEIEENSIWDLRAIPQNTFQDAFQNWKKRWEPCIKSGGECFEGDKFD